METLIETGLQEVMAMQENVPAVSVIMPMAPETKLKNDLHIALNTVEMTLLNQTETDYAEKDSRHVIEKLNRLIDKLQPVPHKKAVVLYAAPSFEKIFFLDIPVEAKLVVGDYFDIRDLICNNKELNRYLLLLLNGKKFHVYLADATSFKNVEIDGPESVEAFRNDAPERVANFADMSERNEVVEEKFIRHIDDALDKVLRAYQVPLFIMGVEKMIGHFKKITKHGKAIAGTIAGNYEGVSIARLRLLLEPCITNLNKRKQLILIEQLNTAAGEKKLVSGFKNVLREVKRQMGRLLVVEKGFISDAGFPGEAPVHSRAASPFHAVHAPDPVDDIIRMVLKAGGDVEFVDKGMLEDYQHIALITFY